MRLLFALGLVMASAAPAIAAPPAPGTAPVRVASWRPHAWQPPAHTAPVAAGLRFEPDTGAPASEDLQAPGAARRQALAQVPVITRADGSRSAVLGGLIRAYTVVHIGPDGRLSEECVHSEEQARKAVAAPAAPKER